VNYLTYSETLSQEDYMIRDDLAIGSLLSIVIKRSWF